MKKKIVAAFLALFAGMFGVHRFYLQRWWHGVMYLSLFFVTVIISAKEHAPAVLIPIVLGLIDALLFFVMPQEDFDEKYNKKRLQEYQSQRYYEGDESEEDPSALMERQERSNRTSQPNKAVKKENKKYKHNLRFSLMFSRFSLLFHVFCFCVLEGFVVLFCFLFFLADK